MIHRLSAINITDFKERLDHSLKDIPDHVSNVNQLTVSYNTALSNVLDEVAPIQVKTLLDKPRAKWYTKELLEERTTLRRSEKRWLFTRLEVDRQTFVSARSIYNKHCDEVKASYHRKRIENSDQKTLFSIVDEISGHKKSSSLILPDISPHLLPQKFMDFFKQKICDIRMALMDGPEFLDNFVQNNLSFNSFTSVTPNDIILLVRKMTDKTCSLDPMPTQFVKEFPDQLAPILCRIANSSLKFGVFPAACKSALVRPLIKKYGLDRNELLNYRPVSNIPFLSKLLEKIVLSQLNCYFKTNSMYAKCQSAYREGHSTETALLRVQNDVALALDRHRDVILVLLDLSAAFDTIDHDILTRRLCSRFGIGGTVLSWLKSYLTNRTQRVCIGSMVSDEAQLKFGVPQGSVLGPVLFSLYMVPLEDIIDRHGLSSVMYADDTQLYIACDTPADTSVIASIEACVDEIRRWMRSNWLALNDSKTEVVLFSSKFKTVSDGAAAVGVRVGDVQVHPSSKVRNLGVFLDSAASMEHHVTSLCKSASFALWKIGKVPKMLEKSSTEKLVHAFVTSRLDYCNSLLFGLHSNQLKKLQLIQNSAARLITGTRVRESITPVLRDLHWLPVEQRIRFKILAITYKIIENVTAPIYLTDLVDLRVPQRSTRQSSEIRLEPPPVNSIMTKYYGNRTFSVVAPMVWNDLPSNIRAARSYESFKSLVKTHLFRSYYGSRCLL